MIVVATPHDAGIIRDYNRIRGLLFLYPLKEYETLHEAQMVVWHSYSPEVRFLLGWESLDSIPVDSIQGFSSDIVDFIERFNGFRE